MTPPLNDLLPGLVQIPGEIENLSRKASFATLGASDATGSVSRFDA